MEKLIYNLDLLPVMSCVPLGTVNSQSKIIKFFFQEEIVQKGNEHIMFLRNYNQFLKISVTGQIDYKMKKICKNQYIEIEMSKITLDEKFKKC